MDPDATYAVVQDEANVTLQERAHHALDLLVWLIEGGHLPGGERKQTVGQRNRVVDTCDRTINQALEGILT